MLKQTFRSFILLVLSAGTVIAQTSKGILAGGVRDTTGAAISAASVTVTSEETGETRNLQTSETGAYRVEAINPGMYKVHVEHAGFNAVDVLHIAVKPSVVTSYDA